MKKRGVGILVLLSVLFLTTFASAQSNATGVEEARQCLDDLITEKAGADFSFSEAVFATLARGSNTKIIDRIEDLGDDNECWPQSGGCKILETAQVALAYNKIGKNTDLQKNWLLNRSQTSTDLAWFLQIDAQNHEATSCTITYQGSPKTIQINSDMTLSGNPGNCLDITSSGFWLKIKSSCLNEQFQVSCEEDFVTSLLYQKDGSQTIFISPNTHSAASSGTTQEKVNARCFKTGTSCDYEGTLWASVTLDKLGVDVSKYIPYLLALAEDNQRYFPEAFIYTITQGDEYFDAVVQSQKQEQFWQAPGTAYNKFYDTALGLLALQSSSAQEKTNALTYLESVQTPDGCWNNNNLRDTAFLLYAGWPTSVPGGSGGQGATPIAQCGTDIEGHCVASSIGCLEAGGQTLPNYNCPGFGMCCTVPLLVASCASKGGVVCSASEDCSAVYVDAIEASCCTGTCRSKVTTTQSECAQQGGTCYLSCDPTTEEQQDYACTSSGQVCCVETTVAEETGGSTLWIILLSILIVLVILGIVFREKLSIMLFKMRRGKSPPQARPTGPSFMPPRSPPPRMVRPGPPVRRPMPPQRPIAPSKSDAELNETLKKLKEMSE